jgi:hypothetical protein
VREAKMISVLGYNKAWNKERENACKLEVILFFKNHLKASNMVEYSPGYTICNINGLGLEKNTEQRK